METNRLEFLWENFTTEKRGSVEQVIHFIEQQGFLVPLRSFLTDKEIGDVHTADVDLRMPPKAPRSHLAGVTIEIQQERIT